MRGKLIECMSWKEAEQCLSPDAVVVIALGAATKEHGLHLQLRNDWLLAEYLKEQVLDKADVVVFPTINYGYYPAFVQYPGSVSLSLETTAKIISEICCSISSSGPRRFYIINTGISTLEPLKSAAVELAKLGILLAFTNMDEAIESVVSQVSEQEGGSHADEIETSMMLQIAADTVCMDLARHDFDESADGPLSPERKDGFSYSPSGVWGNATLASKAKGQRVLECLIEAILKDIDQLKKR